MNPYKVINLDYLLEITSDDITTIKELTEIFAQQITEFKDSAAKAIDEKNYDYIKKLVHKFKSSLRTFGMKNVANALEDIETNPELEKNIALSQTIKDCISQCELAYDELQDFLQTSKK